MLPPLSCICTSTLAISFSDPGVFAVSVVFLFALCRTSLLTTEHFCSIVLFSLFSIPTSLHPASQSLLSNSWCLFVSLGVVYCYCTGIVIIQCFPVCNVVVFSAIHTVHIEGYDRVSSSPLGWVSCQQVIRNDWLVLNVQRSVSESILRHFCRFFS